MLWWAWNSLGSWQDKTTFQRILLFDCWDCLLSWSIIWGWWQYPRASAQFFDPYIVNVPELCTCFCGNFNRLNDQLLESNFRLNQIVKFPLVKTLTLDLFLTNLQAQYEDAVAFPPLSFSDHNIVLASPKIRENSVKTNKVVLRRDFLG